MSAPDPKAVEAGISWLTSQKTRWGDLRQHQAVTIADALIAAARAYLRAPTAPQGAKPVAWLYTRHDEYARASCMRRPEWVKLGCEETPLYAAPQGAEIARELRPLPEPPDAATAVRTTARRITELTRELDTALAKARPIDESPRITFTLAQAKRLVEWFGDDNEPDTEITVAHFPAGKIADDDGEHAPAGLYCWFTDYPEEGSLPLDCAALTPTDAETKG